MASAAPHLVIIIAAIVMIIVAVAGAGTLLALLFWRIREAFLARPVDRSPVTGRR